MIYIGIDPGKDGAVAALDHDNVSFCIGPSLPERAKFMRDLVAVAAQFRDIGQWEGVLAALGIPYELALATTWTSSARRGGSRTT